jgi:hypothetical protein
VAEPNRQDREQRRDDHASPYSATGHPSVERLIEEQGTGPIADVRLLRDDFWPEEESIEDFLETLHEARQHAG